MKRISLTFPILLLLTILISILFPQSIRNSAHDFSGAAWNLSQDLCNVCHARHNASTSGIQAPLWNHSLSNSSYTVYNSPTLNAVVGQPDGDSKLCLSCHDGTVAIDNYGGNTNGNYYISGLAEIGTDLSDDHPISFVYDGALSQQDGHLADPSIASSGLGGTIETDLLKNRKMQCTSCHDVHNTRGYKGLLVKSNNRSALCLTCHYK